MADTTSVTVTAMVGWSWGWQSVKGLRGLSFQMQHMLTWKSVKLSFCHCESGPSIVCSHQTELVSSFSRVSGKAPRHNLSEPRIDCVIGGQNEKGREGKACNRRKSAFAPAQSPLWFLLIRSCYPKVFHFTSFSIFIFFCQYTIRLWAKVFNNYQTIISCMDGLLLLISVLDACS